MYLSDDEVERKVVDLGEAPHEELPISAERIMKQHQNERTQMRKLGPLVPITSTGSSIEGTEFTAMPIPPRRRAYNPS